MPETSVKPDLGALRIDAHKRGSGKAGKRIAIVLFVLLAALITVGGVYAYMHQTPSVQVATLDAPDTGPQALLNASGYVTPQRRATVAAKITGRVTGVFFTEGMHVHKGFVLATLDDSDAQRALASAKADRNATQASILDLQVQLKNAQIELHRAQELRAAGVQTQEALDNATMAANSLRAKIDYTQEQVLAADARIKEAQQAVDNCVISAPFDGIIVSKDAQVGEMVSPISAGGGFTRTGIATIVDMASNEIEVDVNENYIARVKPGQEVTASFGCISRLEDSVPRTHHHSHGRSPEGDCRGAHCLRQAGSAHPARHGREGHVPRGRRQACEKNARRRNGAAERGPQR